MKTTDRTGKTTYTSGSIVLVDDGRDLVIHTSHSPNHQYKIESADRHDFELCYAASLGGTPHRGSPGAVVTHTPTDATVLLGLELLGQRVEALEKRPTGTPYDEIRNAIADEMGGRMNVIERKISGDPPETDTSPHEAPKKPRLPREIGLVAKVEQLWRFVDLEQLVGQRGHYSLAGFIHNAIRDVFRAEDEDRDRRRAEFRTVRGLVHGAAEWVLRTVPRRAPAKAETDPLEDLAQGVFA